jgi:hypothetical protein
MSWRDSIKVHPAADLFPEMTESELRELGEDIKKNGQQVQIVLFSADGPDRPAVLIDGRSRLAAMELVGLPIFNEDGHPAFNLRFMEGDPYDLVLSLNINRRHLTEELRRELIAKVIKAKPEESDRSIAKKVKRDHKTVAKVRKKLESTGEVSPVQKRVGADGKKRGRPPQRKVAPPKPEPKPAEPIGSNADRATGSAEVDAETRRAEFAALDVEPAGDLSIPPFLRASDEPAETNHDQESRSALCEFRVACKNLLPLLNETDWIEAVTFFDDRVEERKRRAA